MKRVLLFGANGLVGHKVVDFSSGEFSLHLQMRNDEMLHSKKHSLHILNLEHFDQVSGLLEKVNPDIIVNAAAYTQVDKAETEPDLAYKINRDFVKLLTEYCYKKDIYLVHISTDYIYDGTTGPYDEVATANPKSVYAKSKYEADLYMISRLKKYAILRAIVVYGYHRNIKRLNFVTWLIRELKSNKRVNIVDDQFSTYTYADDLAKLIVNLCKSEKYGIFNISNDLYLNRYEFSCKIADILSLDKNLINSIKTKDLNQLAMRPKKSGFITEKAKNELKFVADNFENTIKNIGKNLDLDE